MDSAQQLSPRRFEASAEPPALFRSPEIYEKVINLDLNGPVTVAQGKARHAGLVAVRAFPFAAAKKALYMHGRVRHSNIVEALDAFTTETSLYIVLEHMPISLYQIVESAKYPTEPELAAILRQ
ncbi:hypothetical protein V502_06774, partial [Pseudogymnoascus sp. VKM F-4520 (FW-2644)]